MKLWRDRKGLTKDIGDVFRAGSLLITILMAILFFSGFETTKKDQADSNSIIREGPSGHEVHGEVGATYGASASRH